MGNAEYFWAELEKIGLKCVVPHANRLPSLTTVKIPRGIDGMKVIVKMREDFQIEIGGALGSLKGKAWRIGLMGYNSRKEVVRQVVSALKECIDAQKQVPDSLADAFEPILNSGHSANVMPVAVASRL